jgi:hypothetical protein
MDGLSEIPFGCRGACYLVNHAGAAVGGFVVDSWESPTKVALLNVLGKYVVSVDKKSVRVR